MSIRRGHAANKAEFERELRRDGYSIKRTETIQKATNSEPGLYEASITYHDRFKEREDREFYASMRRLEKKYPDAIISHGSGYNFSITETTTKGDPPITIMQPERKYEAIYDPMKGKMRFYERESGKEIQFKDL